MKNVMTICGIGLGTYFLVGGAIFCGLLLFDMYWVEMLGWSGCLAYVASLAAVMVKVQSDRIHSRGFFAESETQESGRGGWTLERILPMVISLSALTFATILLLT